jgi:hypothetical protein
MVLREEHKKRARIQDVLTKLSLLRPDQMKNPISPGFGSMGLERVLVFFQGYG